MKTQHPRSPIDPDSFDPVPFGVIDGWFGFSMGVFVGAVVALFLTAYFIPQIIASDEQAVKFCRQIIEVSDENQ